MPFYAFFRAYQAYFGLHRPFKTSLVRPFYDLLTYCLFLVVFHVFLGYFYVRFFVFLNLPTLTIQLFC